MEPLIFPHRSPRSITVTDRVRQSQRKATIHLLAYVNSTKQEEGPGHPGEPQKQVTHDQLNQAEFIAELHIALGRRVDSDSEKRWVRSDNSRKRKQWAYRKQIIMLNYCFESMWHKVYQNI
jgi:hypothetical protein